MNEERAYTAVQEDATSFCMDWPVFEADGPRESHFQGTVFVLDCHGSRVGDTPLQAPRNRSADEALNRIGWARCGAWHRDNFGRQAARVVAVGSPATVLPRQGHKSARHLGSLAEEASLHLA